MTRAEDDLIVCPLIRLPSEKKDLSERDIESEKQRIREKILSVTNEQLFDDPDSMDFLSELGGDLMINAFACNFKVNGKVNDDVVSDVYVASYDHGWLLTDPCAFPTERGQLSQPAHLRASVRHING